MSLLEGCHELRRAGLALAESLRGVLRLRIRDELLSQELFRGFRASNGAVTRGREHLADILDQMHEPALEIVAREVNKRYSRRAKGEPLVAPFTRGKRRQTVQRDQASVYLGFRVPARVKDSVLRIQFNGYFGVPHFTVQATPWEAQYRLEDDRALSGAARTLESQGFQSNGRYWARVHEPSEYLEAGDLPVVLLELIEQDVPTLVESGILDHDVDSVVTGARNAPPRYLKDARPAE